MGKKPYVIPKETEIEVEEAILYSPSQNSPNSVSRGRVSRTYSLDECGDDADF